MRNFWDVIVVGAGAAGLYASATSALRGRSTLLIEKNRKLGVKILMSGGTRCNITQDTTWQGIADAFGKKQGRFLKFALATLPPEKVVERFNEDGVATKVESTGKIFPKSDQAIDVRDALVDRARNAGVRILNETSVMSVEKSANRFQVVAGEHRFECQSLILTTGGQSYPGCGTTGDGYTWLRPLGHEIEPTRPALTPIRISDPWVRELAGVTIPNMSLTVKMHDAPKQTGAKERNHYQGSFLFTHKGCSGPAVLNISRVVTSPICVYRKSLVCNWVPDLDEETLRTRLLLPESHGSGKQLGNSLSQWMPKRLTVELCRLANVPFDQPLAEFGRKQAARMIQQTMRCEIAVSGTLGFQKAEVTAGGVRLEQVDDKTMSSKIVPGLFLAGEILDVDGPIGGYNFQAAFSTGFVAGNNA